MIHCTRHVAFVTLGMFFLVAAGAGCPKQSPPESKSDATIEMPAAKAPPPAQVKELVVQTRPVATKPAATRPVEAHPVQSQPASTYDPRPPYLVKLHVRSPRDEQPGWLKILKFDDERQVATAEGRFPEQNDVNVTTGNVQRIQVQIGFLPLAPRKRTFLQIDKQGIEINTKGREFVVLERSPAGAWSVVPQKK